MITKCENCGAPLTSTKCKYCGTLAGNQKTIVKRVRSKEYQEFLDRHVPINSSKTKRDLYTLIEKNIDLSDQKRVRLSYELDLDLKDSSLFYSFKGRPGYVGNYLRLS